ncbi:hypothetical protein V6R21_19015 [Limibacter armeniacum]|uniref:hypothetical protein n=1 Tax=Limibacter armeniacum TaxID=466084 RepID=UPI002FE59C39
MEKGALTEQDKRNYALQLYVHTDMTQEEICKIVGWKDRKTFTNNKAKYDWDNIKKANTITSEAVIANLTEKIHKVSISEDAVEKADSIAKLVSSIEKLRGNKLLASNYIQAFKELTRFIQSRDVEAAGKMNNWMRLFIDEKIKNGEL